MVRHLFFLGVIGILSSCASTSIRYGQELPAEIGISQEKTIVFKKFKGKRAHLIQPVVEDRFSSAHYTIMTEQEYLRKARRRTISQKDVLIATGEVTKHEYKRDKGVNLKQCGEKTKSEFWEKGVAKVSLELVIEDPSHGTKLLSKNFYAQGDDYISWGGCSNKFNTDRISKSLSRERAEANLTAKVTRFLNPTTAHLSVVLFRGSDELKELDWGNTAFEKRDLKNAETFYRKAVEKSKSLPEKELHAHALYSLGLSLGYQGKEGGDELIDQAIQLNPEEETYMEQKGLMLRYYSFNREAYRKLGH